MWVYIIKLQSLSVDMYIQHTERRSRTFLKQKLANYWEYAVEQIHMYNTHKYDPYKSQQTHVQFDIFIR